MKLSNILLLLSLALCWGPSFLFIKIVLDEIPVFSLVAIRLAIASCILCLIVKLQGKNLLPYLKYWKHFIVMGFFACSFPFVLISYSEKFIPTSLAGIVNGSPPIFTVILAHFFLKSERISPKKLLGIFVAFLGILIIFLPPLSGGIDPMAQNSIVGILLGLIAAMSYAVGMVYSKKFLSELPFLIGPTFQVLMGALIVLPFACFIDKVYTLSFPSPKVVFSLLSLSVLGTVLSFSVYYTIIKKVGATYLSTSMLLMPLISICLGSVFLGEKLTTYDYMGAFFILNGLVITNSFINFGKISLFSIFRKTEKL